MAFSGLLFRELNLYEQYIFQSDNFTGLGLRAVASRRGL